MRRGQALYEQAVCLTEPETGATLVVCRVTVQGRTLPRNGDTELHILTVTYSDQFAGDRGSGCIDLRAVRGSLDA